MVYTTCPEKEKSGLPLVLYVVSMFSGRLKFCGIPAVFKIGFLRHK